MTISTQTSFFVLLEAVADLIRGDYELDDSLAQPFDYVSGRLYVWEEDRSHQSIGTGEARENFTIMCVIATDNEGEAAIATRSRDVTRRLSAWADQALDAIRNAATFAIGDDGYLTASTDADFLRQLSVRGTALRITGWRILD